MAETPTKSQILMARLVIVLLIAFTAFGVLWYGLSDEVRHRVWQQLIERPGGPMTFRFILQPAMAAIAALRDGIQDILSRRGGDRCDRARLCPVPAAPRPDRSHCALAA